MGRVWFSSHSIETKFSLDNWSVFLQDGVTLFGSDSNELISIEGITSVGLFGVFFWAVLGMFCHPVVVWLALKWGGGVSTFNYLHFWVGLCVYPSCQRRSGSWPFSCWPCCLSPSLRGSVCFGSQAVIPAHGGLLATLPEVRLPGKGCWRVYRVPQILFITPLPGVRPSLLFLA